MKKPSNKYPADMSYILISLWYVTKNSDPQNSPQNVTLFLNYSEQTQAYISTSK